jgi:uncharacterized protein YjbJ (UPF0337 family)
VTQHIGIDRLTALSGAETPAPEAHRRKPLTRYEHRNAKEVTMSSGTTDKVKGRVKEAAGALAGDKKLKEEGKADQAIGKVKNATEKVLDKAKDLVKGR